jgi:hypothetical protein
VPQPARRRPRIRPSPRPQHIPILAPRSGWWCLRRHFSLLSKHTPPGPHSQLIIMLTARACCLSSDPAKSAAACSDCASRRRIPVILATPSPDARRVLARRTRRPQRPAAAGRPIRFRKERTRDLTAAERPMIARRERSSRRGGHDSARTSSPPGFLAESCEGFVVSESGRMDLGRARRVTTGHGGGQCSGCHVV